MKLLSVLLLMVLWCGAVCAQGPVVGGLGQLGEQLDRSNRPQAMPMPTMRVEPLDAIGWRYEDSDDLNSLSFMRATVWQNDQVYSIMFRVQDLMYIPPARLAAFVKQELLKFMEGEAFQADAPVYLQNRLAFTAEEFKSFVAEGVDEFIRNEYERPTKVNFAGPIRISFKNLYTLRSFNADDAVVTASGKALKPAYELQHTEGPKWQLRFSIRRP